MVAIKKEYLCNGRDEVRKNPEVRAVEKKGVMEVG